jgi:FkbM family methyltransferase
VDTLASLVRYRVTGDLLTQPKFNLHEQYLPPRLMRFDGPITFVDGGAYDGDTFRHLSAAGVEISHWIAFEPDPRNFVALTKFAGSLQIPSTMFPCGLNDTFMQVAFSANEGTSSHLTSSLKAEMTVPCVALDDVSHGAMADYIKLDIEGAEQAALLGMRKTISNSKPHLAVSIYHRPDDLWILTQTLAELAPYADLFIRQHCLNAFETVLYAVPRG